MSAQRVSVSLDNDAPNVIIRLRDAPLRFHSRVQYEGECWRFTGYIDAQGYGRYNDSATGQQQAHRFAYAYFVGPIPSGLHIDHLCRHRWCVNPAHLEPVTPAENNRRMLADKTHCKREHEYNEVNTRVRAGVRYCRVCQRDAQRARRRARA